MILAGGGVARAGAEEQLARVAEVLDAPVITTWNGKGTLPDAHPLAAGALFGRPEAGRLLESADTVFALGTTLDPGPGSPQLDLPAQMIQIDADRAQLGRRYPVRLGIEADIREALTGILTALEAPNPLKGAADRTSLAPDERTGPGRAAELRQAAIRRAEESGPAQMAALAAIRRALPADATILHRNPASAPWFFPFFEVAGPGTWVLAEEGSQFPVAEAAAAAGGAPGPLVCFCDEDELIPHLKELEGLEEPGDLTFVVFTDRSDEGMESALAAAASEAGLSVVATSGQEALAKALSREVAHPSHSIVEADLTWDAGPE